VKHLALTIASSIAAAAVVAAMSVSSVAAADALARTGASSPSPATDSSTDASYSAKSLAGLNLLESRIDAAGGCSLPASSLTTVISGLVASPLTAKAGLSPTSTKVCANISAVASPNVTASALTSMWAWGNSVPRTADARGLGEAAFVPQTIAAFSATKNLKNVRLSVPWASDQGAAVSSWVSSSVAALQAGGQTVSALGGDTGWVSNPALVSQWIAAAHSVAPFTSVQLDVEPWTSDANWTTDPAAIASYVAMVTQAEATAHSFGMTLGIDAPWWLSTTPYLSGTALSALLAHVDTVSIIAFSDHAGSTDGIIAQAWPAVVQANAALTPFTIGVQTSPDSVSGGAQYTFADKGAAALETESNKVRAAYSPSADYSGITVEEYLSWSTLRQ
jgi:hypothetical protein